MIKESNFSRRYRGAAIIASISALSVGAYEIGRRTIEPPIYRSTPIRIPAGAMDLGINHLPPQEEGFGSSIARSFLVAPEDASSVECGSIQRIDFVHSQNKQSEKRVSKSTAPEHDNKVRVDCIPYDSPVLHAHIPQALNNIETTP